MLLRQVQARPLQGHHLRALRRRGDAAEGAPRAHGSHRPRRAGLAHLVLQGRAEPHRLPARHRSARAREGPLLRRLDRHAGRSREAAGGPRRPSRTRSPARASGSTSTATRRCRRSTTGSPAGATTSRRARRRTSTRTTTSGVAASRTGPRSRRCRRSRRSDARRRRLRQAREDDHVGGSAPRARARPADGDPRRSPPRAARGRVGRRGAGQIEARSTRCAPSSRRRPARRRARSRST